MCLGSSSCNAGETTVARSYTGNATLTKGVACAVDKKSFCCRAPDFQQIINGCRWTGCQRRDIPCNSDETVIGSGQLEGQCTNLALPGGEVPRANYYCCKQPVRLANCHWKGTGPLCSDSTCSIGEVSVLKNLQGDGSDVCKCMSIRGVSHELICVQMGQPRISAASQ